MKRKVLPAIVWREGKWFVARVVGLELASQGRNQEEALGNLQEALDLLLEDEELQVPSSLIPKNLELKQVYA